MTVTRAAALCALLLAGCPSSEDPQFIDAPSTDGRPPETDAPALPTGPTLGFIASAINLPENAAEAQQVGLDIDDKPNDGVDNQLGMVFGSFGALAPDLDLQVATDQSVAVGETLFLLEIQADDFGDNVTTAALFTSEGTTPSPPPCASPQDQVCGQHLQGTGSAMVLDHITTFPILGRIENNRFTGATGQLNVPIVFGGGPPVWIPLQRAKADLPTLSPSFFTGKIGGAATMQDVDTLVIPRIAQAIRVVFDETCDVGGPPPSCNCISGETGETLRGLFDKPPTQDCQISDDEVRNVVSGFLTPDIDLNGDGTNDAISLGLGVTAVSAFITHTAP